MLYCITTKPLADLEAALEALAASHPVCDGEEA
jgi:hypothetical protein